MKKNYLILGLILLFNLSAVAQEETIAVDDLFDMSLEDLMNMEVTTASKKAESMDEAPNVMYVVTADDIQQKGFKNLKDVLQTLPGFALFLHELGQNIQVRGLAANENEKVTIMVNGRKIDQVQEPIHFDGAINLDNVERIEIIIGPGSVLYGAETLETIINIIPKMINGTEAIVTTGTDGTLSATITTGTEISEDVSFTTSLTYLQRNGYDAYTSDALAANHRNLVGKEIIEQIDPSLFFIAQMNMKNWTVNMTHENLETPEYMVISNNWGNDGSRFSYVNVLNMKNEKEWSDNLNGTFQFHYDNKRQLRVVTESGTAQGPSFDLTQQGYGAEYALQFSNDKHFFQAGLQAKYKLNRHNYVFIWEPEKIIIGNQLKDTTTFVENMIRQKNTLNIGFYLSEEYEITEKLKAIAAARFDYDEIIETDKIYVSPRLSLIYKPSDKWILKGMFNQATRMPNPWESPLNQIYGSENIATGYVEGEDFFYWGKYNSNVQRPEILTDYEIQNIVYFGKTRLSLNVYYQELKDFISWNTPYTNVGDFTGYGGEMSMNTKFDNNLGVLLTASYNENEFKKVSSSEAGFDEGKRPENLDGEMLSVPKITSYLALTYQHELFSGTFSSYLGLKYLTGIPMRTFKTLTEELDDLGQVVLDNDGDKVMIDANLASDYTYADNRIYVDFNLGWTNSTEQFRIDITGKNVLNNQDPLSQTWMREFYQPRGATFMLALRYYFTK